MQVTKEQAKALVGKHIFALRKDGSLVTGKLVKVKGSQLIVKQAGHKVRTKAILPLVLFDLLAIGTIPYDGYYGPYGGGYYDGYGVYGGNGGYGGYPFF